MRRNPGLRGAQGDRVRLHGVSMQPGVLCSILDEGERWLARGSHHRFVEEDVAEVLNGLEEQRPVLDRNHLRRGWRYLARRAVDWKLELEQANQLKRLEWDSLL